MSATLFVSDLHLSAARPAISRLFQDFLAQQARQAAALYILGDLFEYWAGDDDLIDPFNAAICAALKQLVVSGTQTFFMPGNRDFLVGSGFVRASGTQLLIEPQRVDINGFPTLLLHGDTLCTDDATYQEFRNKVRSAAWQENFLAQPLAERKTQIETLRKQSDQEKQLKSVAIMDTNPAAVAAVLRSQGYPRLIHGHTHRPAFHRHEVDGKTCERWVLGDWYDRGNYLRCDETGCRYLNLPAA
jgi:UDP-2,3-diacylglucosamine hydrolase